MQSKHKIKKWIDRDIYKVTVDLSIGFLVVWRCSPCLLLAIEILRHNNFSYHMHQQCGADYCYISRLLRLQPPRKTLPKSRAYLLFGFRYNDQSTLKKQLV